MLMLFNLIHCSAFSAANAMYDVALDRNPGPGHDTLPTLSLTNDPRRSFKCMSP